MANEKTPVVWDDTTKKHRPLGTGEKMGGLDASSIISSDSGNLIQTGSDGLAYVSGSSLADPRADNLLETSGNGKLQVTIDRIVEWLDGHPQDAALLADAVNVVSGDEGNVITAGTDNGAFLSKGAISAAVAGMTDAQKNAIADAIAARIAGDIADGKTIVASGGKLTADPTNATVAQKKAINQALADADSGLVVDNSTGKLQVDFSQMPTDKFEALLRGLKMLVPLSANMNLYVDTNGSAAGDSLIDGRGTEALPFKTVQACVNYVTQTYSVGRYTVYIHVKSGTYSEGVTFPTYARTTGAIYVMAHNNANPPVFVNPSANTVMLYVQGGTWHLQRLNVTCIRSATNDGLEHFPETLTVTGAGAYATMRGCYLSETYSGAAPTSGHTYIRMINVRSGGILDLSVMDTYANELDFHIGNANQLAVFNIERGGTVNMPSTNSSSAVCDFPVNGEMTTFVGCSGQSLFTDIGGGTHPERFVVPSGGAVTGKKYVVNTGAGLNQPTGGIPGTIDGTVETATCGWVV